jgi:hypothetical protein
MTWQNVNGDDSANLLTSIRADSQSGSLKFTDIDLESFRETLCSQSDYARVQTKPGATNVGHRLESHRHGALK